MSSRALNDGFVPLVSARSLLSPTARPATRPISTWPGAGENAAVWSRPSSVTETLASGTPGGTSIRTRTSPPLTRSAAVDTVDITSDGWAAWAAVAARSNPMNAAVTEHERTDLMNDLLVVSEGDEGAPPEPSSPTALSTAGRDPASPDRSPRPQNSAEGAARLPPADAYWTGENDEGRQILFDCVRMMSPPPEGGQTPF